MSLVLVVLLQIVLDGPRGDEDAAAATTACTTTDDDKDDNDDNAGDTDRAA